MTAPPCPRCGVVPPFEINAAVSMTAHYEEAHPTVSLLTVAREVVGSCGR